MPEINREELIERFKLNNLAYEAAKSGHATELVELIEQGAKDLDWAAIGAATTGHSDVLMMLTGEYIEMCRRRDKYPTVTELVMNNKSIDDLKRMGYNSYIQDELTRLFRDDSGALLELSVRLDKQVRDGKVKYTRDYQDICNKAAMHGYIELIEKYMGKVVDLDQVAYMAARGGHDRILDLVISRDSNLNFIATGAARTGREDILNKLIDRGATNIESLARIADLEYYIDVAKRLRDRLDRTSAIPDVNPSSGQARIANSEYYIDLAERLRARLNRSSAIPVVNLSSGQAMEDEEDEEDKGLLGKVPQEVFRTYLPQYMTQRDKNNLYGLVTGATQGHMDELNMFTFERLLDYLDDHPNSKAAISFIDRRVRANPGVAFQRMMDFDSTFILKWFPTRTTEILRKALEDKREAISAKAAAKIYVERLAAGDNSAQAINYLRALVSGQ